MDYVGIDVHKKESHICIVAGRGFGGHHDCGLVPRF